MPAVQCRIVTRRDAEFLYKTDRAVTRDRQRPVPERSVRVDLVLLFGGVTVADDVNGGHLLFQFGPLSAAYLEVERAQVFLQVRKFCGARNRNDPVGLVEHPEQGDLRGGHAVRTTEVIEHFDPAE